MAAKDRHSGRSIFVGILRLHSIFELPREVRAALKSDVVADAQTQAKQAATNAMLSYETVKDLVGSLKSVTVESNGPDSGCVLYGDLLICWGTTNCCPPKGGYGFDFVFAFPRQFHETPTVTTSIYSTNTGTGDVYAIDSTQVSITGFKARTQECNNRQDSGTVRVNYIAIGR